MLKDNLKELRQRKALSIRDLEKLANVSTTTIVKIESGCENVHPSTLKKLADALKVSVKTLTKEN